MPATWTCPSSRASVGTPSQAVPEMGPKYWTANVVSPVLFRTAVAAACCCRPRPHRIPQDLPPSWSALGPSRPHPPTLSEAKSRSEYVSVISRGKGSHESLLAAVGELWLRNQPVARERIVGDTGRCLTDLPAYPWHYEEPLWRESRLSKEYRLRRFPHHELLGHAPARNLGRVAVSSHHECSGRGQTCLWQSPSRHQGCRPGACSPTAWYRKIWSLGLDYGPRFRGCRMSARSTFIAKVGGIATADPHPVAQRYYSVGPSRHTGPPRPGPIHGCCARSNSKLQHAGADHLP